MFQLFQFGVVLTIVMYLWQCHANLRHRNNKSWQRLTTELEQWPIELVTPWARFQRTRVLLEMADFVEHNCRPDSNFLDSAFLSSFREEALEGRVSALIDVLKSMISTQVTEQA
jgi:hypothetical protein